MAEQEEFRYLVRIANTDLDGKKGILSSLRRIKGVNSSFANAIMVRAGVERNKKVGFLTDEELKKIETVMRNPAQFKIPSWMFNRRKDYETGGDSHLLTTDLDFVKDNDIKMMKKIRSYKGKRHSKGLPVRGQRTKGHFRKGKSLGVARKKGRSGRV